MRDKNWNQEPGGSRDDTCEHGLSRSWKVKVWEKEEEKKEGIIHSGVIRLSLGELLVNQLQVVKRTNTPLIP